MALEIKVLDYGDIELESSFLVLGRDCGRVRRVPVLGFLVLGGTWPQHEFAHCSRSTRNRLSL